MEKVDQSSVQKTRYSDAELAEFKVIIEEKLAKAKAEYNTLRQVVMHNGTNDIEDTTPSFRTVEDDGAFQLSKEEASQMAQRQYKFIQNLEAALIRIENKTNDRQTHPQGAPAPRPARHPDRRGQGDAGQARKELG